MKTKDHCVYNLPIDVATARKLLLIAKENCTTPVAIINAVVTKLYNDSRLLKGKPIGHHDD
jgi:hypothetical protein